MGLGPGFVEGVQVLNLGHTVLEKIGLPFLRLGFPFRK